MGIHRQLKKEKFKFSIREHRSSVFLAFKALVYGTALCTTSFGIGAVCVQKYYNIQSIEHLGDLLKTKFDYFRNKNPVLEEEKQLVKVIYKH